MRKTLVALALTATALLTGAGLAGASPATPLCTTDRDCADWAVAHGVDPDADPYTRGKAPLQLGAGRLAPALANDSAPLGTGHAVGQTVPSCDHIDWANVQPVDLNHDGYIDCGSDLELGA